MRAHTHKPVLAAHSSPALGLADSLHVLTVYVCRDQISRAAAAFAGQHGCGGSCGRGGRRADNHAGAHGRRPSAGTHHRPPSLFANPTASDDEDSAEAVGLCRIQTTLLFAWCVAALDAQKARRELAPLEEGEDGEDDEEPEEPEEDDTPWIYVSTWAKPRPSMQSPC